MEEFITPAEVPMSGSQVPSLHPIRSKLKKKKTVDMPKSLVPLERKQGLGGYHGVVEPALGSQTHRVLHRGGVHH